MSPAVRQILLAPFDPYRLPGLAARYDASDLASLTCDSSNRVSQWSDKSGRGRHLVQGTGSAQPLLLPYAGSKYLYVPGVANNIATTPDAAALAITSLDAAFRLALNDWTPPSASWLVAGQVGSFGAATMAWYLQVGQTDGLLTLVHADGTNVYIDTSSAAPTIADGAALWLRVTMRPNVAGSREIKFYTAADAPTRPSSWTQLGTTVTGAASAGLYDTTTGLAVGGASSFGLPITGKIWYCDVAAFGGAAVRVFDVADAVHNATSWTSSSTGETWTVGQSSATPAQIVGRSSVLGDAAAYFAATAAFTLGQPTTIFAVAKQTTWAANGTLLDGTTINTGRIYQTGSSPNLGVRATTTVTGNGNLALGSFGLLTAVMSGAASSLQVNRTAAVTGDIGTDSMGGLTLLARGDTGGGFGAWQVQEVVIFSALLAPATLWKVQQFLASKWGIIL